MSAGAASHPSLLDRQSQVTQLVKPGDRMPLFSTRTAVSFQATDYDSPLASTKLYWLETDACLCV